MFKNTRISLRVFFVYVFWRENNLVSWRDIKGNSFKMKNKNRKITILISQEDFEKKIRMEEGEIFFDIGVLFDEKSNGEDYEFKRNRIRFKVMNVYPFNLK